MSFKSVNEVEKFSFEDCQIMKFEVADDAIIMELEALIVRPNNSQNTNYTESYAATTIATMDSGRIVKGIKLGYKYYDANETLIEEVPDRVLTDEEIKEFVKGCKEYYLYRMDKTNEEEGISTYGLEIEIPNDEIYDTSATDSFYIEIQCSQAVFKWEQYLNRVQR